MQFGLGFISGLVVGGCIAWILWPPKLGRDGKGRFVKR